MGQTVLLQDLAERYGTTMAALRIKAKRGDFVPIFRFSGKNQFCLEQDVRAWEMGRWILPLVPIIQAADSLPSELALPSEKRA